MSRPRLDRRSAGSVTLVMVSLLFLLATLGLGLSYLVQVYQRLGVRKISAFRVHCSAENGAKQAYAALARAVRNRSFPCQIDAELFAQYKKETAAGSLVLAETALGLDIPFEVNGSDGPQSWEARFDLRLVRLGDKGDYVLAAFRGETTSEGRVEEVNSRGSATLEAGLDVLAGFVPLLYFPLLAAGPEGPENLNVLMGANRIEVLPSSPSRSIPGPAAAAEALIPGDATPFLEKALKIKIFAPDKLNRAQLRSALGLPLVNEPVPDGVYLIHNDTGLGGVFVQGDVEEMILAVHDASQLVQFRLEEGLWRLEFVPSAFKTHFLTPGGVFSYERTPLPIILVNGKVESLGGGVRNADGTLSITQDPEIPSVLDGVSLSIICADEVTLTSHLIQEGVRWSDGIPYLKDSRAQLVIHAGGRDFVEGTEKSGKIKIGRDAPRDLQVHASLSARGGFESPGAAKEITVAGGVQTSSFDLGSNRLRIAPDERLFRGGGDPAASPQAAYPILSVLSLEPRKWRE